MTGKATVAADASLRFSSDGTEKWGLAPGAEFVVEEIPEGVILKRVDPLLARVHVEPTTSCNLSCRTCVRQSWEEPLGFMEMDTFHRLVEGLRPISSLRSVSFWGIGEPLLHPHIVEMVALAKGLGARTEIITNGLLLTRKKSAALIEAGLDSLVVSVDGVSEERYEDVRPGPGLGQVLKNIEALQDLRVTRPQENPEVGLEFVAMRRNIHDLPHVARLALEVGATRVIVTNLLPYAAEMKDEILYGTFAASGYRTSRSEWNPEVLLPRMDLVSGVPEALSMLFTHLLGAASPRWRPEGAGGYCRFVSEGSVAVGWDGRVSPCVPLLHSYRCYVMGREKQIRGYTLGSVNQESIANIWQKDEYVGFRDRVVRFDFAPCTDCGGCELAQSNERDCAGGTFPVCGDCLWAKGVIQCP
ncbi:MAG: radical SAM protein [Chloroflexota bacterium]